MTCQPNDHRHIDLTELARLIPDVIILMSSNGEYLDVISNYGETQLPPAALVGKTIYEVGMPKSLADYFMEVIQKTIKTKEVQYIEYDFPKDNKVVYYEARVIKSSNNNVIVIIRNITKLKTVEEQMRNAYAKLIEIDRINSHEIRRPVASILGLLSLINPNDLSKDNAEIFDKINSCSVDLDELISKIVGASYNIEE